MKICISKKRLKTQIFSRRLRCDDWNYRSLTRVDTQHINPQYFWWYSICKYIQYGVTWQEIKGAWNIAFCMISTKAVLQIYHALVYKHNLVSKLSNVWAECISWQNMPSVVSKIHGKRQKLAKLVTVWISFIRWKRGFRSSHKNQLESNSIRISEIFQRSPNRVCKFNLDFLLSWNKNGSFPWFKKVFHQKNLWWS